MLSNTLNTNEIKNSAGTEVEFSRQSQVARQSVFSTIVVDPSKPHTLSIAHTESGTGMKRRRRSVVRFDKAVVSDVDDVTVVTDSAYCVLDMAIGASETTANAANVLAELMSFLATTGAATAVLFDGSGNGATTLLNGSL